MISKIKSFLGYTNAKKPITDFSEFFHNASSADKKRLLTEVVREANKDQRELIERYNRRVTKTT
jgi:hypothetical protein